MDIEKTAYNYSTHPDAAKMARLANRYVESDVRPDARCSEVLK